MNQFHSQQIDGSNQLYILIPCFLGTGMNGTFVLSKAEKQKLAKEEKKKQREDEKAVKQAEAKVAAAQEAANSKPKQPKKGTGAKTKGTKDDMALEQNQKTAKKPPVKPAANGELPCKLILILDISKVSMDLYGLDLLRGVLLFKCTSENSTIVVFAFYRIPK